MKYLKKFNLYFNYMRHIKKIKEDNQNNFYKKSMIKILLIMLKKITTILKSK